MQDLLLVHDSNAFLFSDLVRLLQAWPYAHPYRVFLLTLAYTGMRTYECDRLKLSDFGSGFVCYRLGKNQKGTRTVSLPPSYFEEFWSCMEQSNHPLNAPWSFTANSLRRKLLDIRPTLGGNFLVKRPKGSIFKDEYIINLKSFRATYQCLLFWQFYSQPPPIGGSGELAAAFVSKHMHHSGHSFGLTAKHYISSIHYIKNDLLRFKDFFGCSLENVIKLADQTQLGLFFDQREQNTAHLF